MFQSQLGNSPLKLEACDIEILIRNESQIKPLSTIYNDLFCESPIAEILCVIMGCCGLEDYSECPLYKTGVH